MTSRSQIILNVALAIAMVTTTSLFIYYQRKSRPRHFDAIDRVPVHLTTTDDEGSHENASASDVGALDLIHAELAAWQRRGESVELTRSANVEVQKLRVCVVGLGGVGSHCAMVLARAGVGELRLIDFDQVTLSSLNRHAVAERADVGLAKVFVMQRHIAQCCGAACRVDPRRALFSAADAESLLCEPYLPDVLVDCIDNVDTKAYLIEFCVRRNISVVVCTGSGARLDPAPMLVNDLQESHTDPLIRSIRRLLRKERDVGRGVRCVASDEVPTAQLLPVPDESVAKVANTGELAVLPNFRVRIMPVYSPLPCAFGSVLAQEVLRGATPAADATPPVAAHLSAKQIANLKNRLSGSLVEGELTMSTRDIEAAFDHVWNGRHSIDETAPLVGLLLVRWRLTRPCDRDNVVLLGNNEVKPHVQLLTALHRGAESLTVDRETVELVRLYGAEAVARVEAKLIVAREELARLMRAVS